ncbi:unnamed protein product [Euphydryas editha]|uniref:Insulin-like domain-containing protein n=1 Tax=Euphydryas editha TaxID=104508 RepID=A0AAU9V826_EUPED|nr:unnamed protein product [Euphydryas editha]
MLLVVLSILLSICSVHSEGIYGNLDAVTSEDRIYVQDLIDMPKPLNPDMMIKKCSKFLDVALIYLCPQYRGSHSRQMSSIRQKRQIVDECCKHHCTLENFMLYCP